jgi:hypothetical protein
VLSSSKTQHQFFGIVTKKKNQKILFINKESLATLCARALLQSNKFHIREVRILAERFCFIGRTFL